MSSTQNLHRPLKAPFANGRTAELFEWEEGLVLKLFRSGWNEEDAKTEADKTQSVHAAGLPVPAVGGMVWFNGRPGIVYERISGSPLTRILQAKPWAIYSLARMLAELHVQIHEHQIPELPSFKKRISSRISSLEGFHPEARQLMIENLALLPDLGILCHGDFHPENVFITDRGPVILDWMDAASGSPLGDVARTTFLLNKATLPADMPGRSLLLLMRAIFLKVYLGHYFAGKKLNQVEWKAWQTLTVAARLAEGIPKEKEMLIAEIQAWVKEQALRPAAKG